MADELKISSAACMGIYEREQEESTRIHKEWREQQDEITRLRAENERLAWRVKSLEATLRGTEVRAKQAERERDEARLDHAVLCRALVGDTGLSAIEEAHKLTAARAEGERLREALTPSAETKAAYMGEFHYSAERLDEDGNSYPVVYYVPWTTVKEIMAAVRNRAALNTGKGEKEEGKR